MRLVLVTLLALAPLTARAEAPQPAAPASESQSPTVGGKTWRDRLADRLVVEGLLDVYYAYQAGGSGVQSLDPHQFDETGNSFMLAFAKVGLGLEAKPVGFRLDLGFGHVADVIASDKGATDAASVRPVEQAYLTLAPPTRVPVAIDVGKFVTSAGAEVIEANRNWNYSRSFLFENAIPYTLTGVRVSVVPTPRLTLQAMLVNGWDVIIDNNGSKTFGLSASFAAPTGTTLSFNGLAGVETVGAAPPWRLLADVVVAQHLGRVDLMVNVDLAREGVARWYGVAGYGRVAVAAHLNLALRGEAFWDHGGRFVANQNTRVEELTFTAGFPIAGHAELRAEARSDFSDQLLYAVGADMRDHQLELLAAALAWF
jgi:Putative beta-barrel porin-2, OmpL-like. bbp2